MTGIRIKSCRQTGPYGKVPQNRFWFVPNCEWSEVGIVFVTTELAIPSNLPTYLDL